MLATLASSLIAGLLVVALLGYMGRASLGILAFLAGELEREQRQERVSASGEGDAWLQPEAVLIVSPPCTPFQASTSQVGEGASR